MAKKKNKPVDSEEITDVLDLEELEMELSDDFDDDDFTGEKTVELDLSEPVDEPKEKKTAAKESAKKSAKPKKDAKKAKESKSAKAKKEKALDLSSDEEELEEDLEPKSKKAKPKKAPKAKAKEKSSKNTGAAERAPELPAHIATQSLDSMVQHWNTIKESSDAISKNFERVNGLLQELPSSYDKMITEMARRQPARSSKNARMAIVASVFAIVLSGISMIFSQSVRQAVLDEEPTQLTQRQNVPAIASRNSSDLKQFQKTIKKSRSSKKIRKRRRTRRRR